MSPGSPALERLQIPAASIRFSGRKLMQGNEAICEGAIAAGVRFYAGYPITPCTEIAEYMSARQPQVGGVYLQMEDEVASIHAVIGASITGAKAMTATAGPGISLMQDGIGWTQVEEVPAVIVNVQRAGPGLGNATRSGQMDVMQARWGPNGDRAVIALAPASVDEAFWVTVKAVNLAERLRTGVLILAEGLVGLMREVVDVPDYASLPLESRRTPEEYPDPRRTYDASGTEIHPFAAVGSQWRSLNGNFSEGPHYAQHGNPLRGLEAQDYQIRRLHAKIEERRPELTFTVADHLEDAEIVFIAFGTQARAALFAAERLRADGRRVGTLRLITVWPFPDDVVRDAVGGARLVVVPEMNMGQVRGEVERALRRSSADVIGVNHVDSTYIVPDELLTAVAAWEREATAHA